MSALEPPMGELAEGEHRFPVRVYYEDTDAGGIVYHAAYLRLAERARTEFLRVLGWPHQRLRHETGFFWAVRRVEIDYVQPARLDDALVVATRLVELRGASMVARQVIRRGAADLARLTLSLVLLTEAGRPARLPPALRGVFLPFVPVYESAPRP